jgi:hypothetical protein
MFTICLPALNQALIVACYYRMMKIENNALNIKHKKSLSSIPQPVHKASLPADNLRFLAALKGGWMVTDVAEMIAHGRNDDGRSYLLTLAHMQKLLVKEMIVSKGTLVDTLLAQNGIPTASSDVKSSKSHRYRMAF